jgi:spore coat protein CotH
MKAGKNCPNIAPCDREASPKGEQSILIARFLAQPTLRALDEAKLQLVYEQVFVSGSGMVQAEQYIDWVSLSSRERNHVNMSDYESAANQIRGFLSQRANFLSKLEYFSSNH